ncbi:serine hydrolase [Candidatus Beckwithbacteria bacterium]|nr:serine hydrolase [Candidatus Beckwithbacteria bacterium]
MQDLKQINSNLHKRKPFWLFLFISILCFLIWFLNQPAKNFNIQILPEKKYEFTAERNDQNSYVSQWTNLSAEELKAKINNLLIDKQGEYGWLFYSIKDNYVLGENYDKTYPAASINKIPIVVEYLRQVENGEQDLGEVYTLARKDVQDGSGTLINQQFGSQYTYQDLVSFAGKYSDNTAVYVLAQKAGIDKIQAFVSSRKMNQTNIEDNTTSAKDMTLLLIDIYNNKIFQNQSDKQLFLDSLTQTEYEDRIPAGIPANVQVVHKIGNGIQIYSDCGLVLAANPYGLCILTEGIKESEVLEVVPKISQMIWDFQFQRKL